MKEHWEKTYAAEDFVYGKAPNLFFKECLEKHGPGSGSILAAAEGEGRNAVYAAGLGYRVTAFDLSEQARVKAMQLAGEKEVSIDYRVGRLDELGLARESFEIAVLTFAHFMPELRRSLHRAITGLLKPGGLLILEGFSVNNLELKARDPRVGGPGREDMLFTPERISGDFEGLEVLLLEEIEDSLDEGSLHQGISRRIRFLGRKKP